MFADILKTVFVGALPILEARAAIPLGITLWRLTPTVAFLAGTAGTVLAGIVLAYGLGLLNKLMLAQGGWVTKWWNWLLNRTARKFNQAHWQSRFVALVIFIALPLPGTGVYTGALAGYLIGLKSWQIAFACTIGGVASALLVLGATLGVIKLTF